MNKFIEQLRYRPGFYSEKGQSEVKIELAEKLLRVKFSPDFRECLREFGAISVDGHEFTGFSVDANLDIVKVTQKYRQKHNIGNNLYVIEEAHIDGIVIWQNSDGIVYETDGPHNCKKIADSLEAYLL